MNIYYKINENIINNYNNKYRNYETIDYLNQFENNYIIYELKSVIEKNTILDKFKNVCNIYSEMNIDEISLIYNTKGKKEIELFCNNFSERYKKVCKIIINGKEQELKG